MKLSEAIRIGATFRGESHQGPFVRVANTEDLRSDVWGAACEAVHSLIAKRNWNKDNQLEYDADIEALRELQQKYFAEYFKMPATCPGANPGTYINEGVRVINRRGQTVRQGEEKKSLPAITTVCPSITNLAELIEHMFYVHNWTREECADACEWYEQRSANLIVENFDHHQDLSVQHRKNTRLTTMMRQRELDRRQRRQHQRVYFTN